MSEDKSRNWYTVEEVAQTLSVHVQTIRRAIRQGKLKAIKFGNRGGWRIAEQDLQSFLEEMRKERPAA